MDGDHTVTLTTEEEFVEAGECSFAVLRIFMGGQEIDTIVMPLESEWRWSPIGE